MSVFEEVLPDDVVADASHTPVELAPRFAIVPLLDSDASRASNLRPSRAIGHRNTALYEILAQLPIVNYRRADYSTKDFFRVKDDVFEAEYKAA